MNRPRHRIAVLLLAVFQLGIGVTIPIADALLEAASAALPTHVESASDSPCGPAHDHLFCQLCRTLSLAAPLSHGGGRSAATPATTRFASWSERRACVQTSHLAGPLGPRAPPAA